MALFAIFFLIVNCFFLCLKVAVFTAVTCPYMLSSSKHLITRPDNEEKSPIRGIT